MAAEIVLGANEFTEQPVRTETIDGEKKVIRTWEGPQALLSDKVAEINVMEPEKLLTQTGVPARIEAVFPDSGEDEEDPVARAERTAVWELIGQDLDKALAVHPYYNRSGATVKMIEEADEAIRKGTARKTAWDTLYSGMHIQHYVDLRLRGVDTYVSFSYIVRKTIVFNNAAPILLEYSTEQDSLTIPGTIIQWNQIQVPSTAKFEQPKVHTYDQNTEPWQDVLLNEWLVKAPTLKWQKNKRIWELSRDWWGAEKWPMHIYDGGTYEP